jgi:hypothetical protein
MLARRINQTSINTFKDWLSRFSLRTPGAGAAAVDAQAGAAAVEAAGAACQDACQAGAADVDSHQAAEE